MEKTCHNSHIIIFILIEIAVFLLFQRQEKSIQLIYAHICVTMPKLLIHFSPMTIHFCFNSFTKSVFFSLFTRKVQQNTKCGADWILKKAFKKLRPNPKPYNKGQKGEQRKNASNARNIKSPEWRHLGSSFPSPPYLS